jgi:hypothetical protein
LKYSTFSGRSYLWWGEYAYPDSSFGQRYSPVDVDKINLATIAPLHKLPQPFKPIRAAAVRNGGRSDTDLFGVPVAEDVDMSAMGFNGTIEINASSPIMRTPRFS